MGEVAGERAESPEDAAARKAAASAPTAAVPPPTPGPLAQSASTTNVLGSAAHGGSAPVSASGETTAPSTDGRPGAPPGRVGEHAILGEIARGGMGVVYRARHERLGREVALKMLSSPLASASEVERFRVEAAASASLDHPGIVPVYDYGEHEGRPWLSLKLIPGGSLRTALPKLARDPRAVAALLARIARAMDHAHRRGVLHRDLKPANVLIESDGSPVVTDFGLAKLAGSGEHLTETGAVVGTPSYMAPEQARGERSLTTAVDVYALGAILYEALTGRPPHTGPTPLATVLAVLEKDVVAPRALAARVDRSLETICLKCLDRDPTRRYPSAAALAEDLERWGRGEPIGARQDSLPVRVARWARRRPAPAALLVVSTLAVVAGVLGTLESNRQVTQEIKRTVEAYERLGETQSRTIAVLDSLREQEKETALALYRSRIALAQAKWLERDTHGAEAVLDSCSVALRGFEWNVLDRQVRGEAGRIDGVLALALAPDSRRVAVVERSTRKVRILELEHGTTLARFDALAPESSAWDVALGFSPDGSRIAVASGRGRETHEIERGLVATPVDLALLETGGRLVWRRSLETTDADPIALSFSPGGDTIAVLARRTVHERLADEAAKKRALDSGAPVLSDLDGGSAYAQHQESRTYLVASGDGSLERTLHAAPWDDALTWSADGKRLLAGALWDVATWAVVPLPESGRILALSPDGTRVAFAGGALARNAFAVLDVATLATVSTCAGRGKRLESVAFGADGERVFSGSWENDGTGDGAVADAATGDVIVDLGPAARLVAGSRDGRWLAVMGPGQHGEQWSVRFFDVATRGRPRPTPERSGARLRRMFPVQRTLTGLLIEGPNSGDVTWSADGSRLLANGWSSGGRDDRRETLRLLDGATGETVVELADPDPPTRLRAAFSPDGKLLAAPIGRALEIHDAATGARVRAIDVGGSPANPVFGRSGRFIAVAVSDAGRWSRQIFRVADGARCEPPEGWGFVKGSTHDRGVWLPPERLPGLGSVAELASAPAEFHLALAWPDGDGFWVEDKRGVARRRTSVGEPVLGVALDHDGLLVAVATELPTHERRVRVFEVNSGKECPAPPGLEPFVGELGPNAQRIELADMECRLGGNRMGDSVWDSELGGAWRAFAPDGWRYVLLGDRPVLRELPLRHAILELDRGRSVACAWSRDGERVVLASEDGLLRFWDWRRADDFFSWRAHASAVHGLEFSPDGTRLASDSEDRTIVVLDGSTRARPWVADLVRAEDRE